MPILLAFAFVLNGWERPTPVEYIEAGGALTLSALDMLQTLDIKNHPPKCKTSGSVRTCFVLAEGNPLLGSHPTDLRVVSYFSASVLLVGAAWYWLPPRYRWAVPLVSGIVEAAFVGHNVAFGLRFAL